AALLPHVEHHAAALSLDEPHGLVELRPAVAPGRAEDVAREALRVDAHEHRVRRGDRAVELVADADPALAKSEVRADVELRAVREQVERADVRRQLDGR